MLYLLDGLGLAQAKNGLQDVNTKEFNDRYNAISNEFFRKIQRELQDCIARKEMTKEEGIEMLEIERKKYPEQFDVGKVPIVKKLQSPTPLQMVKKIRNGYYTKLAAIYDSYLYFSQYEHFTIKTEEFLERDRDEEFQFLAHATSLLLLCLIYNVNVVAIHKQSVDKLFTLHSSFSDAMSESLSAN